MLTAFIIEATAIISIITGLGALWLGDWSRLKLKYAAVALSTCTAIMILIFHFLNNGIMECSLVMLGCELKIITFSARNIAIILFHVAVGRDALQFSKKDRRRHSEETRGIHKEAA